MIFSGSDFSVGSDPTWIYIFFWHHLIIIVNILLRSGTVFPPFWYFGFFVTTYTIRIRLSPVLGRCMLVRLSILPVRQCSWSPPWWCLWWRIWCWVAGLRTPPALLLSGQDPLYPQSHFNPDPSRIRKTLRQCYGSALVLIRIQIQLFISVRLTSACSTCQREKV